MRSGQNNDRIDVDERGATEMKKQRAIEARAVEGDEVDFLAQRDHPRVVGCFDGDAIDDARFGQRTRKANRKQCVRRQNREHGRTQRPHGVSVTVFLNEKHFKEGCNVGHDDSSVAA